MKDRTLIERVRDELAFRHAGAAQGIPCRDLALRLGASERDIRGAVTELRLAEIPICGRPETGYFYPATAGELDETCDFLTSRSLHGLKLVACMRKRPLAELLGQVRMELEAPNPPSSVEGP